MNLAGSLKTASGSNEISGHTDASGEAERQQRASLLVGRQPGQPPGKVIHDVSESSALSTCDHTCPAPSGHPAAAWGAAPPPAPRGCPRAEQTWPGPRGAWESAARTPPWTNARQPSQGPPTAVSPPVSDDSRPSAFLPRTPQPPVSASRDPNPPPKASHTHARNTIKHTSSHTTAHTHTNSHTTTHTHQLTHQLTHHLTHTQTSSHVHTNSHATYTHNSHTIYTYTCQFTYHLHTHTYTHTNSHVHTNSHTTYTQNIRHTPIYLPPAHPNTHQLTHAHTPDIPTDSHTTYTHTHTQRPLWELNSVKLDIMSGLGEDGPLKGNLEETHGKGFPPHTQDGICRLEKGGNIDFFGAYSQTQQGSSFSVTSLLPPGPAASPGTSPDPQGGRPLRGCLLHVLGWELAGLALAHRRVTH